MFIEVPLFSETSPALKNSWLGACTLINVELAGLQLYFEYYEIFKNSFLDKTPPVASKKLLNFPGKHQ